MIKSAFNRSGTGGGCDHLLKTLLRTSVSAIVVTGFMAGQAAHAQDAQPTGTEEAEPVSDDLGNVIVVSGIRQSLAKAQDIKRDADTVVDAITAEDIGALPDRSVTEALQRVPGIAINRFAGSNDPDHFSVEGSGVVIRGLNYVRSEFNGRDAFVAGVGGQALNFADVPSELLGSVIIAKNSTADMIEGGLAGTVNLNTRKPFDSRGFKIAFGAEANYGDFRKKWTPTFSGLISNTWETEIGTFGILASGAYSRIKSRADGAQVTNYQTRDGEYVLRANAGTTVVCRGRLPGDGDTTTLPAPGTCGAAETAGADGFVDQADVRYAPLGGQFRTQEFDRKRDGFSVSAQFESIDRRTQITAEFIRSHTTNDWGEYTFETGPDLSEYNTFPLGCQQNANGAPILDSAGGAPLTDGTAPGPRAQCPVGGFQNYTYNESNLFQSGYIVQAGDGWRGNNPNVPIGGLQQTLARRQVEEETTNEDWSLHMKSELTDRLTVNLDAQYATSRKQNLDFSVFGSNFADQELDLTGDLPVFTPHAPQFTSYSWDGTPPTAPAGSNVRALGAAGDPAVDAAYFTDPRFTFWRAAMDHIEDSSGDQFAFKGDLDYDFGEDAFIRRAKVGARFSDRDQTVRYSTYNWGMLSEVWSGGDNSAPPINFADSAALGQSTFYEFPNFFRGQTPGPVGGFYYDGNLTGDYQGSIDFLRQIQALQTDPSRPGATSTWNPLAERPDAIAGSPFILSDIQPINQQDFGAYAMLSFGADEAFGGARISGNVGLRYVSTDVRSEGNLGVGTQAQYNIADPFEVRCAPVSLPPPGTGTAVPGGVCQLGADGYAALQQFADGSTRYDVARKSYDYWLPSANLKVGLSDEIILRFAASKVLTRPDNAYLRNFLTIGLDGQGNLTGTTGNPFLKPATAWQFDATAEWYFASVGSLTLNLFYKDISNFFYQAVTSRSITNNGVTQDVLIRGPANFDGNGKIKGFEAAYQQTFEFLPGLLGGLGAAANYTYIKSSGLPNTFLNGGLLPSDSTVPPGNLPLEQLSKHNVNATIFYEKGPISMRAAYNWRSRFLLTASDVIFPYYSIFNEPTGQLDGSIFVNVTPQIKVGVQGVNLLNEVTKTTQAYTGDPGVLAPRSYFMNDRRFSFIARANF